MWKKIRGWGQNSRCMWINGGEEHYKRTPCLQTVWISVTSKELAVVLKKIKPPVIHYVGQPSVYVSVSEVITYHNRFRSCIVNDCLSCLWPNCLCNKSDPYAAYDNLLWNRSDNHVRFAKNQIQKRFRCFTWAMARPRLSEITSKWTVCPGMLCT